MRALPMAISAALAALSLTALGTPSLFAAVAGAAGVLFAWHAILLLSGRRRTFTLDASLRRQHYLQACAQFSVLLYWGWFWRPVYAELPLILAQVLFAYGVDWLLAWTRRGEYSLGFGPLPVVFSINLFLWFKPDWFAWQFAIVAVGLLAKEFIRWTRDGQRVHIFNPSSFPLAIASLALLAAGVTGITYGPEIATTQFYPPQMFLFLFLIGLPGQYFFGVTSMTMSAVVTTYAFGLAYFAATGTYFFYDSYIPIAVFLGMHLLFTDPSTSPRTELGRVIFGCLYGLGTIALYQLLGMFGLPAFYDKLLPVPILNLLVPAIDRVAKALPSIDPGRLWPYAIGTARHARYIAVWAVIFMAMSAAQGVGDRHPGQWLPFWRQACAEGRDYACPYLADLVSGYCDNGSPWACNEAGLLHLELVRSGEDLRRTDPVGAAPLWARGCELRLPAACENFLVLRSGQGDYQRVAPSLVDWPIVLRGSKGTVTETNASALLDMGCEQGWREACEQRSTSIE